MRILYPFSTSHSFLIFVLIVFTFPSLAQVKSPYAINWKYDGPILAGALGTFIGARIQQKNTNGLSENDLLRLNSDNIWSFDRGIIGYHSDVADDWSDVCLGSSYLVTGGLLAGSKRIRKKLLPALVVTLEAYFLNRTVTGWFKVSILRNRPIVYDPNVPLERKLERYARFSFFSGHTSFASVLYFSSAKIFADYFPNSKYKPLVWAFAATIPAVTGFLRTRAGKHFYTDVITGYTSGAIFGILVPHFHKLKTKKQVSKNTTSLKVLPTANGIYCALGF